MALLDLGPPSRGLLGGSPWRGRLGQLLVAVLVTFHSALDEGGPPLSPLGRRGTRASGGLTGQGHAARLCHPRWVAWLVAVHGGHCPPSPLPSGWPRGAVPLDPASLGAELPAAGVSGFFWGAAQLLSPRNTRHRRACCPSADSSSLKPYGSQTIFGKEGLLAVWRADLPAFAQGSAPSGGCWNLPFRWGRLCEVEEDGNYLGEEDGTFGGAT